MLPRNPTALLLARLSPGLVPLVESVLRASPVPVYAVGGAVRDLALDRPIVDIDLAVETDPAPVAAAIVSSGSRVKLRRHARFGTVSLLSGERHVDVAMCRTERYPLPAALPEVSPATIEDDLRRRDFTINAMAVELGPAGTLLDPLGGLADIESGTVRALHDNSFVDDPTRLFRACRYAGRLGFRIDERTLEWMSLGVPFLPRLSAARTRNELMALLSEARPGAALELAAANGILGRVVPQPARGGIDHDIFDSAPAWATATGLLEVRFALLLSHLGPSALKATTARLALPRLLEATVQALPAARVALRPFESPHIRVSEFVSVCERFPRATLAAIALASGSPALRVSVESYLESWSRFRPATPATEIEAIGARGPEIGAALAALRALRLDGEIEADGERAWLLARFSHPGEAGSL